MAQAFEAHPAGARDTLLIGVLAVTTLTAYFFSVALVQTWGLYVFLLVWLGVLALRPRLLIDHLRDWLMWLLPLLCLLSTGWSRDPAGTLRASLEFIAFTATVLTFARVVSGRTMIVAFAVALTLVAGLSFASGRGNLLYGTNTYALTGIFASKNMLTFTCAILAVAGLSGALDRGFAVPARLALLGCAAFGMIVGYLGRSLGGSVATLIACLSVLALTALGRLPRSGRAAVLILAVAGTVAAVAGVLLVPADTLSSVMLSVGKDPGLTGRAFLWGRAVDAIAERPWLGVGFGAYWRVQFVDALGLYRFGGIASETGFHFHNLYYETAVELGYVGVAAMAATLLGIMILALRHFVRRPDPQAAFVMGIMILLLSRVGLEVDFLSPFSLGGMLAIICYLRVRDRSPVTLRSRDAPQPLRNAAYA